MERYHIYKLGIAILFYAVYCRRPMVNGLKMNDGVESANKTSAKEDYYVYYQGVQGKPGVDFPVHSRIPRTGFSCKEVESGYYADLDTDCQVFHICNEGTKVSFLCPNGTIFQQSDLICDWWFKVNCTNSPNLYVESAEQLRESNIRRKASRRVYSNDEMGKFHNQFTHRMDVSEEMQVGAESAGFYGSGLNSIATTKKERNPYPNHRTTYSEVKYYTNLPTPASVAKSTINNGKPFVVSTPKLGVYTTERSTFRYSPTVPTIRPTAEAVYSTYKQGKTTFGVRSTARVRTDTVETFTNPPSVANGKSTTARKPKHNKNSFTIGLNSLQGAVPLKTQVSSTPAPKTSNRGVIRLNLSSDGGAKALNNHTPNNGTQNYESKKSVEGNNQRGTSNYNQQHVEAENQNSGRYNSGKHSSSAPSRGENVSRFTSSTERNHAKTSNIGTYSNTRNTQPNNFGSYNADQTGQYNAEVNNQKSSNSGSLNSKPDYATYGNTGQYNHADSKTTRKYSSTVSSNDRNNFGNYNSNDKNTHDTSYGLRNGASTSNSGSNSRTTNSGNNGFGSFEKSSTSSFSNSEHHNSHNSYSNSNKVSTSNTVSSQNSAGHYTATTSGFSYNTNGPTIRNNSHTSHSTVGQSSFSSTGNVGISQQSQTNVGQHSHSTSSTGSYNVGDAGLSTTGDNLLNKHGDRTLDLGENANGFVSDAVLSLSAGLQPPVSYSNVLSESGSNVNTDGQHNSESHTVAYNNGQTVGDGGFSTADNNQYQTTPGSAHSYNGDSIESHTVSYYNGKDNNNAGHSIETHTVGYNSDHTVTNNGLSTDKAIYNTERSISDRNNDATGALATLLPPLRGVGNDNSIESSTKRPSTNTRIGKSYDGQTDRPSNGFFVTRTNTFRPAEFITADFNSGSITGSKNTYIPTTKAPIYTSTTTEYVSNTFGFVKPTGVPKPKPFEPASTTERTVLTTVAPDYEDLYNLQYQISSASPFTNVPPTLPTSYHTNAYELTSTKRPFNEHVDNMLDTLKEIADVRENDSPRPGLLVPPSVGPQTLHTLAVYFANALDNLVPEEQPAQEEMTTVDEDLVINSLLSKKTVSRYNELFMKDQQQEESDAVEQDENDLNSEHSSNAVQSPRVRQLAKVFTQALSSYLDDPDMFRKVLQQVRPTEPPPLRTLPTDNPEEDELLNFSDADIKPELPRLPTPPPANPTWGYILAFNNSNNNHLDNNENLQTADSQSFVPGYNDIRVERTHWTQSPEVTKLWRNTLLVDPQTLNENLEKTERPDSVDYELRALPTIQLNSTQVHGLLINFMNSTDDSEKLKRILDKLNTTQDEFLEKMKQIEENPLTRRLILLLVSECASNSSLDKADTVRDILSLANPNSSGESLQSSSTDWEAVALRSNLTLDRKPSAFTKLVDPNLKEEDQDARALQLLNSLYSIASKYGK